MKVVIIDNDGALLRSLEILLSRQGHDVNVFDDPLEGYSFIKQGKPFDVLILDYLMPELNGKELLQKLNGNLPKPWKVILISGHTDCLKPNDLVALGVDVFLPKPLDIKKLNQAIGSSC